MWLIQGRRPTEYALSPHWSFGEDPVVECALSGSRISNDLTSFKWAAGGREMQLRIIVSGAC